MSSSKSEDDVTRALATARRYVRASVRSRHEVTIYLHRRGVSPEIASRAVAMLGTQDVLNDGVCARLWAEQWARRGYASAAIRLKLAAKGLDEETITQTLTQRRISVDDAARARALAARATRAGAHHLERTRVARRLASRGFDPDLIEQILNESFDPLVSS